MATALTLHTYHITENKNPCQWITSQEHTRADTNSIKRWVRTLHSACYTCIERRLHQEARNSCLSCQNIVHFVSNLNDGTDSRTMNWTYILPHSNWWEPDSKSAVMHIHCHTHTHHNHLLLLRLSGKSGMLQCLCTQCTLPSLASGLLDFVFACLCIVIKTCH